MPSYLPPALFGRLAPHPPPVEPSPDEPLGGYGALLFCLFLEGARQFGALGPDALTEPARDLVLAHLSRVRAGDAGDEDPHERLVRDLRGAVRLGLPWWEPGPLQVLLAELAASFGDGPTLARASFGEGQGPARAG